LACGITTAKRRGDILDDENEIIFNIYERSDPEFEECEDMEIEYLDTWVGDDRWHKNYERTGSIELDPDWY
jgi:hypothetical protein